jgi:XTP/dITP diphosphohydrolase
MSRLFIATSNAGKLRDFRVAAVASSLEIAPLPGFASLPAPVEDQPTFELNARKKAEHYSRFATGELVLADDSGLEVEALSGAPGVHSARYAASADERNTYPAHTRRNSSDRENNARLLYELELVSDEQRTARFVCAIAVAGDGNLLTTVRGEASGVILDAPRGDGGFGYDPLFFFPALKKTFAELTPEEKAEVSHRGQAFRKVLAWYNRSKDSLL